MLNKGLFTSSKAEWATPPDLFRDLDAEFHFDLDPCATPENAKCEKFYTIEDDGLAQDWGGAESVLQSAIWQGDLQVGAQVLRGEQEGESCRYAHTGQDGHFLFSRLHMGKGGDPFHQAEASFRREQYGRALPFNDSDI